jgi:hypothetical protein
LCEPSSPGELNLHILSRLGISCFYHFTDRSCLPSIAEHGLLSWVGLDKEDIGGRKGSSELSRALDTSKGLGDFVRLSFTTRHPMMYVAQKDGRLLDPVVLEIHLSVVLIPGVLFSDRNATASSAELSDSPGKIRFDVALCLNHFAVPHRDRPFFQAEILVPKRVSRCFIKLPDTFLPPFIRGNLFDVSSKPVSQTDPTPDLRSSSLTGSETPSTPPTKVDFWEAITTRCREQSAAVRWSGPPPLFSAPFSCGDPYPSLTPEASVQTVEEPLSCQFHVGPSPPCHECVPDIFVCGAHFVACKAQCSIVCPFCKRVLCSKHRDCFCAERDEAKQKWNSRFAQNYPESVLERAKGIDHKPFAALSSTTFEPHRTEKLCFENYTS